MFPWYLPVAVFVVVLWIMLRPPSGATRRQVELSLKAKGMSLLTLKKKHEVRLGRSSRVALVARAQTVFGPRNWYFEVDAWADAFSRHPSVRELGTSLDPLRDFS